MKKNENADLDVKVVDCSRLEAGDVNAVLGKIFEEAYGSAEDGSTTMQKPLVLII